RHGRDRRRGRRRPVDDRECELVGAGGVVWPWEVMSTVAIAVDGNSRPGCSPMGPHPVPAQRRVVDDTARCCERVWGAFLQEADRTFDDEPEFLTIDVEMS